MARWRTQVKIGNRVRKVPRGTCQGITADGWAWYIRLQAKGVQLDRTPFRIDGRHVLEAEVGSWAKVADEANRLRAALRTGKALDRNETAPHDGFTVEAALQAVMDAKLRRTKSHKADLSVLYLRLRRLKEFFGPTLDVRTIKRVHLLAYADARLKEPDMRGKFSTPHTVLRELGRLKSGMSHLGVQLPKDEWPQQKRDFGTHEKNKKSSAKPRSLEEVQRLLTALERGNHAWVADLCAFVAQTGLRKEEVAKLRRSWLIRTSDALWPAYFQCEWPREHAKEDLRIRLTPESLAIVERAMQLPKIEAVGRWGKQRRVHDEDDLLWGTRYPQKVIKQAGEREQFDRGAISLRDLRATYGRRIYDACGIYAAMVALRHADISTTMIYLDLEVSEVENIYGQAAIIGRTLKSGT